MSVVQLTTLPANGQHLAVPIRAQARNSRSGVDSEGIGMAERIVCR
jgi:hypothetical protein